MVIIVYMSEDPKGVNLLTPTTSLNFPTLFNALKSIIFTQNPSKSKKEDYVSGEYFVVVKT